MPLPNGPSPRVPRRRRGPAGIVLALSTATSALVGCGPPAPGPLGTPELRAALFDTLLARTARRDAFSPVKETALGYDPMEEMRGLREMVVGAATEEELFYALARLSHARRNRHLDVALVPGGLTLAAAPGVDRWPGGRDRVLQAPVRILPDYGAEGGYFVGDLAEGALPPGSMEVGDRVVAVNGLRVADHEDAARPYHRHSSKIGLRWRLAESMAQHSAILPPTLRSDSLELEVLGRDGRVATHRLPYLDPTTLRWEGHSEPHYPGFAAVRTTPTWTLLLPEGESLAEGGRIASGSSPTAGPREPMILLWTGFRETMVPDVDTLVALGARAGLLDRPLVVDVTRSRGGSLGPYALQRLQPHPFRTTHGNLRLSDVTPAFIDAKWEDFRASNINDGGVPETVDGGGWLMDWLETDVRAALARGDTYTAPVPFKLAHAPRDSDGILPPAPMHFRGPLAVISGPSGGSHLDQFNAIVVDNALGPVVGMTSGGYSNTWEWEEVLTFPGTRQPVIGWMYDIGHTLRPDGSILEGNPAAVDEWIPLTAAGHRDYYPRLLAAALAKLGPGWGPVP